MRTLGTMSIAVAFSVLALPFCCPSAHAETPPLDITWVWTEEPDGTPVIDRGPQGAWDHLAVDNPFVLVDGDRLLCYYEAQDKPFGQGGHERVGVATSRDGLHWEKWKENPVLDTGPKGAWDSVVAKLPTVATHEGAYFMFYSGRDGKTKQIGVATSGDGCRWTKHTDNPVLRSRPGKWDRFLSTHPAPPFEHEGKFYLLYRGMRSLYSKQGLGLAVFSELVGWQRAQDDPVIAPTEEVASIAAARTGDGFLGIAQSPGRPYWFSEDLRTWRKIGAAKFTGPRVDTLSNPFFLRGKWIVLYEQGDRIYRAVLTGP